jgi:hypothetical protein
MAAAMAWLLCGCGPSLKDQVEHAQDTAEEALSVAQGAASALDDGTASGNTLASEVEEAKQVADAALAAAEHPLRATELHRHFATVEPMKAAVFSAALALSWSAHAADVASCSDSPRSAS